MHEPWRNDTTWGCHLGRYQLIATLGQGGMGTIHLAVAAGLGEFQKLLVLKELRRDLAQDSQFVEMFLREAKLAARLNHPNVVQTLEAGRVADRYFLSMEFLDGKPFSEVIRSAGQVPRPPLQLRMQILCDVLAGLHYAHELRDYSGRALEIVHRDVSPENVFITYDGHVKVVDFGIAKVADAGTGGGGTMFKGKWGYAAPEQLRGMPADRRSDIFAAGVVLWEAIALTRFSASGPMTREAVDRRLAGAEPRIAEAVPGVDPQLASICDRALAIEPKDRFRTAEEFRTALSGFASSLGPWLTPSSVGRFMATKFAPERSAMHRLIRARLGRDNSALTGVRTVGATPRRAEEDITEIVDLSEMIEVARPAATARPAPTVKRRVWLSLGAVVGAGAAALVLTTFTPGQDPGTTGGSGQTLDPSGLPTPDAPVPAAQARGRAAGDHARRFSPQARGSEDRSPEGKSPDEDKPGEQSLRDPGEPLDAPPDGTGARSGRPEGQTPRTAGAAALLEDHGAGAAEAPDRADVAHETESGPALPEPGAETPAEPSFSADRLSAPPGDPQPTGQEPGSEATSGDGTAPAAGPGGSTPDAASGPAESFEMGKDLKRAPLRPRRLLDTDNPFR